MRDRAGVGNSITNPKEDLDSDEYEADDDI
jgi:hypothetical protein